MEWERVACGLCGGKESRALYHSPIPENSFKPADFQATTDQFGAYGTVVRCRRCGLVYASPRPDHQFLLDQYQRAQDPNYLEESESRSINAFLGLATLRRHVGSGNLLDVGCSTGFFLNAARTYFNVEGVEPSLWAGEFARRQLGLNIVSETIEKAAFPAGRFDVVTMIDVIEHLPDPVQTVREAARVLKPGGWLYLVTPDIGGWAARILRGYWWGLRPAHLFYFSGKTLSRLLQSQGFEVVEKRSFGKIFTYGYWVSRLRHYPAPVHQVVRAVIRGCGLESKFVYINTRDSMEICARKKS